MNNSDERTFLHDIASPLATAILLIDIVLDMMKKYPNLSEAAAPAEEAFKALEAMRKLIDGRREVLIKRGNPSATES